MRENENRYDRLVGKTEGREYFALDYTFNHGKTGFSKHGRDFKGATATVLTVVSKQQYDEQTDPENYAEYLIEAGLFSEMEEIDYINEEDVKAKALELARSELMNSGDEAVFDYSGYEHHDEILRRERAEFKRQHPELVDDDVSPFPDDGGVGWTEYKRRIDLPAEERVSQHPAWPEACECIGGGRAFGRELKFTEVYSLEGIKEIAKFEGIADYRTMLNV